MADKIAIWSKYQKQLSSNKIIIWSKVTPIWDYLLSIISGHVIKDNGTIKPQRTGLNFIGATITDDSINNETIVTISSGGITNHAALTNLDYVSSGHSGFQSTIATGTTSEYLRGDGSLATFPTIPAAQVPSDWNSVINPTQILNKPIIPSKIWSYFIS